MNAPTFSGTCAVCRAPWSATKHRDLCVTCATLRSFRARITALRRALLRSDGHDRVVDQAIKADDEAAAKEC